MTAGDLAELHTRIGQLERRLVRLTTWLLAAVFALAVAVLLVAVS